jgi:Uma2 family endonuclease
MTAVILDSTANKTSKPEIFYPSSDGKPLAESYDHLYVIMTTLAMLLAHLKGQQATVLADQFLYYVQGFPRLRVAPDVMVIFDVEPGGRDNYKIWEEGQVPSVIFEMTSPGTRSKDDIEKKDLYQGLGVTEYWQFDPRGEWIPEQLKGFRLTGDEEPAYVPIANNQSEVLQLQLVVEGKIIGFYRLDNGEKLLPLAELNIALAQQIEQTEAASQRAEAAAERADREAQKAQEESQRADREAQRSRELEAQIAIYQQQLGELPTGRPNLLE